MTFGRRALFRSLAGFAGAAAMPTRALLDVAAAMEVAATDPAAPASPPVEPGFWAIVDEIGSRHRDQRVNPYEGISVEIATKRSWSTAYKQHWHAKEMAELRALRRQLEADEAFASRAARMLGWVR